MAASPPADPAPGIAKEHDMKVGETADINVDGHPARTDSPGFGNARTTMHKICDALVAAGKAIFEGPGPYQAHHGGSLWVYSATTGWLLFLNKAGIEWSSQFCAKAELVDALRQNYVALLDAFPETEAELTKIGLKDVARFRQPVVTADDIAWYTDSLANSCVPINAAYHIGFAKSGFVGEHNDPKPITDIQHFKVESFQLLHVDPATGGHVAVVPVAAPGSGDSRVQVIHTSETHPLHAKRVKAHTTGNPLVLAASNPLAKAAFANQQAA
jgi:hypothetical protein